MSLLSDLFKSVSEPNLTKSELENYHTKLSALYAQIHEEMATLEKEEAIYFLDSKRLNDVSTDVAIKRVWNASPQGQRLIELKHYSKGAEKLLGSLKSRLYGSY